MNLLACLTSDHGGFPASLIQDNGLCWFWLQLLLRAIYEIRNWFGPRFCNPRVAGGSSWGSAWHGPKGSGKLERQRLPTCQRKVQRCKQHQTLWPKLAWNFSLWPSTPQTWPAPTNSSATRCLLHGPALPQKDPEILVCSTSIRSLAFPASSAMSGQLARTPHWKRLHEALLSEGA